MTNDERWRHAVAAAHAASMPEWIGDGVVVHRIGGGANNALYRVEVEGRTLACKLCVNDERRRAAREFGALRVLSEAGLDLAPRPVWLDESCTILPFPAVAYEWLPGAPIVPVLDGAQLAVLLQSIQSLHSVRFQDFPDSGALDAWFHWFDLEPYMIEMRGLLADYGSWLVKHDPDGAKLLDRLQLLVDACGKFAARSSVWLDRDCVPVSLCRVDPNLANMVWNGDGRLRWVDWEYSGWGDPALDLADLRWHAALEGLGDMQHAWLRSNYRRPNDDPGFDARLAVWDRVLIMRWPLLILRRWWSTHNGLDRARLGQLAADEDELRARLLRFIERTERLADGGA